MNLEYDTSLLSRIIIKCQPWLEETALVVQRLIVVLLFLVQSEILYAFEKDILDYHVIMLLY